MSASQTRKEALGAVLARQNRVMANDLGYQENDRKCPLCHETYWHASDDPALAEAPLRTSCCRKIVGAECFRLFLSPSSDAGGNNSECPICRTALFESTERVRDDQASTASVHFRKQVKLFQETRKLGIRSFRQERAGADCALYEELYDEGIKLPAPLDSKGECFGGTVEPSQRTRGLDSNQAFALFFELQREGAFKPNDSNKCELEDTELYKNLRKAAPKRSIVTPIASSKAVTIIIKSSARITEIRNNPSFLDGKRRVFRSSARNTTLWNSASFLDGTRRVLKVPIYTTFRILSFAGNWRHFSTTISFSTFGFYA